MNRFWTWRWPIALAVLAALLLGASGCASGAVRATSWTGLTVAGDVLYAADLTQIQALNAADGEPLWTFPENLPGSTRWIFPEDVEDRDKGGTFYVTPAVDERYVIVASHVPPGGPFGQPKNIVWALEPDTGEVWYFDGAASQYIEGGAIGNGVFVIGNSDGNVYALDVESGDPKWERPFETGHRVWATPLIVSDTVYVGSMDRHLYALDLANGQVRWDFHAQGAFASTPALRNGTLYVGAFDNRLYAIDAETGTELWRFESGNWFWGSPAVYDDIVYAADVEGNVYAVDADTGEEIWHRGLDVPVRAGLALSEDGSRLFVSGQDGALYALDTARRGADSWRPVESEGQALSTPAVNESIVYEALIYGQHRILALYVENGGQVWAYPDVVEE